jgi:hypothetical protein
VRIPLDYYRILGVLIDAESSSIEAAYRDRREQQPRREYSEFALRSRHNLMDEAYALLSRPSQRVEYDRQMQEKPSTPKVEIALPTINSESPKQSDILPYSPYINIHPQDFSGALSILQELGEYEIVCNLGYRELKNRINYDPEEREIWQIDRRDIILSIALSCLQRGREEYENRDYEASAICQQEGLNLLRQEGVLLSLQEELERELHSLRPYRILGLLSLELDRTEERQGGLRLLKEMLQERRGIEGKGEDRSGLSAEEFIHFVDRLRDYLTVDEQLEIFETEANRPSAAAMYLLSYTLLAKGFAHRQPEAIVRAQSLLKRFNPRQDVYLERSICALLLGRTEAASNLLFKSQETESIAFIQEHSQGSPDLLPGLCLYGERWLEGKVLSEFRDLRQQKLNLKAYFADRSVQEYLEKLAGSENADLEAEILLATAPQENATAEVAENKTAKSLKQAGIPEDSSSWYRSKPKQDSRTASIVNNDRGAPATAKRERGNGRSGSATLEKDRAEYFHNSTYFSQPDWADTDDGFERRRPRRKSVFALIPAVFGKKSNRAKNERRGGNKIASRPLFLGLIGLTTIVILAWLALKPKQEIAGVATAQEQPLVTLQEPAIDLPQDTNTDPNTNKTPDSQNSDDRNTDDRNANTPTKTNELNESAAKEVVERWLAAKRLAMGSQHDTSQLAAILDGSLLQLWQGRSSSLKASSDYWQYQHTLAGVTIVAPANGKTALIQAKVRENATYYRKKQIDRDKSYDQNLVVNYNLVWKKDRWTIAAIQAK